jgi:hypothetical protein
LLCCYVSWHQALIWELPDFLSFVPFPWCGGIEIKIQCSFQSNHFWDQLSRIDGIIYSRIQHLLLGEGTVNMLC